MAMAPRGGPNVLVACACHDAANGSLFESFDNRQRYDAMQIQVYDRAGKFVGVDLAKCRLRRPACDDIEGGVSERLFDIERDDRFILDDKHARILGFNFHRPASI
jgi:hypothetical protein